MIQYSIKLRPNILPSTTFSIAKSTALPPLHLYTLNLCMPDGCRSVLPMRIHLQSWKKWLGCSKTKGVEDCLRQFLIWLRFNRLSPLYFFKYLFTYGPSEGNCILIEKVNLITSTRNPAWYPSVSACYFIPTPIQ